MTRMTPDEVNAELVEQKDLYGSGANTISGHAPSTEVNEKSTIEHLEDYLGNDPRSHGVYDLGEELERDRNDMGGKRMKPKIKV